MVQGLDGSHQTWYCPGCLGIFGLAMMVGAGILPADRVDLLWQTPEPALDTDRDGQPVPAAVVRRSRKKAAPAPPAGDPGDGDGPRCVLKLQDCAGAATETVTHPDSDPWPVCAPCAAYYRAHDDGQQVV